MVWYVNNGTEIVQFEVQSTIKRVELWAFLNTLLPSRRIIWEWYKVSGGVKKVVLVRCKKMRFHRTLRERINHMLDLERDVDVEHVNAHRTKKEKKAMTSAHFFVCGIERRSR